MKEYDKSKESSNLKYYDVNNWYGWKTSQKLHVSDFKWVKESSQFNRDFIQNYNEDSDEGYFLEVDATNPEILHGIDDDLLLLPEKRRTEKVELLVTNLQGKKELVLQARNSEQALNQRLVLKKYH